MWLKKYCSIGSHLDVGRVSTERHSTKRERNVISTESAWRLDMDPASTALAKVKQAVGENSKATREAFGTGGFERSARIKAVRERGKNTRGTAEFITRRDYFTKTL